MNVNRLHSALDCVGYSGNTLSNEQWIVLHNSLIILQTENHFKNIYLWGMIYGQEADYVIAFGFQNDALFGRKFFYSLNLLDWGVMPAPNDASLRLTGLCPSRFQGDPALVIEVLDDDPGPSKEELERRRLEACLAGGDSAAANIKPDSVPTVTHLKEEDRLAATIELINNEVVIAPRGALYKQTDGKVIMNTAFEGLPWEESRELKSYLHCRRPHQTWNTNLLTRKDYNYAIDFLDTIDKDLPKGCWTMHHERGGRLTILRNLYWPGFTGYHWVNTPDWGYLYVGHGKKDWDLPFMIFS